MPLRGLITGELGDFDWTDEVDNWTEGDAEWIQNRSVVRVAVTSGNPANKPTVGTPLATGGTPGVNNVIAAAGEGRVIYDTTYHRLMVAIDGSETYAYPVMAKKLQAFDTTDGTIVELRNLDASAGQGLTLTTNNAKVKTLNLTQTGGGVAITLENSAVVSGADDLGVVAAGTLTLTSTTEDIVISLTDSTKTLYLPKITKYDAGGGVLLNNSWGYRNATRPTAANVPEGTVWIPI